MVEYHRTQAAATACYACPIRLVALTLACSFHLSFSSLSPADDWDASAKNWALQPLRGIDQAAEQSDPAANVIDRYVLNKLAEANLKQSAKASPNVLLRRLFFDLVGLPPTSEELKVFCDQCEATSFEDAYAAQVDRLLASKAFGECWGRHWLDVARYAESSGKEANISFPYAWRYRDYVIDSFNADIPYNRFIVEQLAGDLLPYENEEERARLLIATGFLALGPKNLDEANEAQFRADVIDEQIDATCRSLIGQSIACARCHDHKTDPYSMEDYYGLAGVFASTTTYFGTAVSPANRVGGDPLPLPLEAKLPVLHPSISREKVVELEEQRKKLKQEHEDGMSAVMKAAIEGRETEGVFTLRDALRIFWTVGGIEGQLEKVGPDGKALPLAMGVLDSHSIVDSPLLERGDINSPAEAIPRRLPEIETIPSQLEIPKNSSGRLEFAQWLASEHNPLTLRVVVNRVWLHLFGQGLVMTADDFGNTGEPPVNPELLDFLATRFAQDDWSIKTCIRNVVLSKTYQQSSDFISAAYQSDPDNRLLWRMPKRRLSAEAIRDAILKVSGELDMSRPIGSLVAKKIGDRPIALIGLDPAIPIDLDGSLHRSVYLPILRDRLPDVLATFDFAEPSLVTGDRDTTNVPTQSLYLMNSPFVMQCSEAYAKSIDSEIQSWEADDAFYENLATRLFTSCFSRSAKSSEVSLLREALPAEVINEDSLRLRRLTMLCQAIFASAEFRCVD